MPQPEGGTKRPVLNTAKAASKSSSAPSDRKVGKQGGATPKGSQLTPKGTYTPKGTPSTPKAASTPKGKAVRATPRKASVKEQPVKRKASIDGLAEMMLATSEELRSKAA